MTLYQILRGPTGPWLRVAAAGVTLCSLNLSSAVSADMAILPAGGSKESAPVQEPLRLPEPTVEVQPIPDSSAPVSLTAGETITSGNTGQTEVQRQLELLYQQNGRPMPQLPQVGIVNGVGVMPNSTNGSQNGSAAAAGQPGARAGSPARPQSTGIFSKFGRMFGKSRPANNPPADPGMNYPTGSQSPQQRAALKPNPAPGVTNFAPGTKAPGLFRAPSGMNPLREPAGSPGQHSSMAANGTAANSQAPPQHNNQLRHIPELSELLSGQHSPATKPQPLVAPESNSADGSAMPKLNLTAPAPERSASIAPAEPARSVAVVPPQPAPKNDDPFDNLFPEDASTATQPAVTKPDEAEAVTQPYTGLSLDDDDDLEDAQSESTSAAPAKQLTVVSPAPGRLTAPPTIDLSVPADLPQLSGHAGRQLSTSSLEPRLGDPSEDAQAKLRRIAERRDRPGLKGFCPVVLRDQRELLDSSPEFAAIHDGQRYEFSSRDAMALFIRNPDRYLPAASGRDVIHLALTGESLSGSLDHAVWYKGRLYLFSGVETMETFSAAPSSHAVAN